MTALNRADAVLKKGRELIDRLPIPRSDKVELRLHKDQRKVDRLRRLNEIYWPYGALDCVFDDRNTRELLDQLHPDDRERFGFDVDEIDWDHYLGEVHLPALRAIAVPPAPGPKKTRSAGRRPAPEGPPALAIFDVEGVVLDSTVAHFYAWLRTRDMPEFDKLVWTAGVAARVPGWIMEDRRSRTAFNRSFYRLYKDLPSRELRAQAKEALPDFIQPRIQHEAIRRIREHKRRGDRVILITGALDFLVESLAAPRRRADRRAAGRARRALHRRARRAAADRRRPRQPGGAAGRRPRRRPRRLPRLRRQPGRPADARAGRPPAPDQPGLPAQPRGAPAALADRDVDDRDGRGMKALTYTPTLAKYVATRAGLPGAGALALDEIRPPRAPGPDWLPVRPTLTGICGSDLALLSGKASLHLATLTCTPFVPGHEIVGEIGAGPRRGERVVVQPALGCTRPRPAAVPGVRAGPDRAVPQHDRRRRLGRAADRLLPRQRRRLERGPGRARVAAAHRARRSGRRGRRARRAAGLRAARRARRRRPARRARRDHRRGHDRAADAGGGARGRAERDADLRRQARRASRPPRAASAPTTSARPIASTSRAPGSRIRADWSVIRAARCCLEASTVYLTAWGAERASNRPPRSRARAAA